MIGSREWPTRSLPESLQGKIKMGRTKMQGFRTAEVALEDGVYVLIESNPAKVVRDSEGNGPKDKVMVKRSNENNWLGQVRRYPEWHFKKF